MIVVNANVTVTVSVAVYVGVSLAVSNAAVLWESTADRLLSLLRFVPTV